MPQTCLLSLPAPAKINLFLHILGRRSDGYHDLQTVFQFLLYGDQLDFYEDESLRLTCNLPEFENEDNLILRAARKIKAVTGITTGIHIHLNKNLPSGAGLGGGSSDAATTLLGLNRLWKINLSIEELSQMGAELGADVPVFIRGQAAWAEGIGERLTPIEHLDCPWYVVLTPPVHVVTSSIFQSPQLTRDTPAITLAAFHAGRVRNDCEPVVCSRYPEVKSALDWLSARGQARMTGTGACVFLACATENEAVMCLQQAPYPGFVARSCNRSPAMEALEAWIR
ncbi:MAG: 4-(cytidine 5'-diphospho)-2-C-methyl-D-erythritol kinase [Pseudomonadales bacterium]|nr:4-(cytidine 5'-diphospho)-2-C-methyl-D-erythritol kinase [Pseudomonadales bacterium]